MTRDAIQRARRIYDREREIIAAMRPSRMRYSIEVRHVERGGPDYTVLVRRPHASTIAIGVGCGRTVAEALRSARNEVRLRRMAGQFR